MIPILFAAAVLVGGTVTAWYYSTKTEEEKLKQEDLIKKRDSLIDYYNSQLSNYNKVIDEKNKILNEKLQAIFDTFYSYAISLKKERSSFYNDLNKIKDAIDQELKRFEISPNYKKALLSEKRRSQDAIYRLDSYLEYIDFYIESLENIKNDYFIDINLKIHELSKFELADTLLPEEYLHVGFIGYFSAEEIIGYRRGTNKYNQTLIINDDSLKSNYGEDIPVLIDRVRNGKYYGSICKGELYLNYLYSDPPISFEIECLESKGAYNLLSFKELGYPNQGIYYDKIKLYNKNKISPLRKYQAGEKFQVYPIEWDITLKNIEVSEKKPDFNQEFISSIPIVFNDEHFDIITELESILQINEKFTFRPLGEEKNKILMKNMDIHFECTIFTNQITIDRAYKETNNTNLIKAEIFFPFDFIHEKMFKPEIYINLEDNILNFYNTLIKEFDYQNFISNNPNITSLNLSFFQKWVKVIDKSIENEKYNLLYEGNFKSYTLDNKDAFINLELEEEKYKEIKSILSKNKKKNKLHNKEYKIKISGRLKNEKEFDIYEIGKLKDIDNEAFSIKIKLDGQIDNFEISDENYFSLFYLDFPYPLIQQKKALLDFSEDKIENKELKNLLLAPELLSSTLDDNFKKYLSTDPLWQNQNLTENQKSVIKQALLEKNIYLIQGPPGTGKTTTIKELVYQYLNEIPNAKILIVSQQNVAVDNALSRIYNDPINKENWFSENSKYKKSIVRCGRTEKIKDPVILELSLENWFDNYRKITVSNNNNQNNIHLLRNIWNSYIDHEDIKDVDNQILEIMLKSHQIVGATCIGLAQKNIGLNLLDFDLVIVDEAGRATPPELLIPILRGKKIILIGDHYQLPPTVSRSLVDDDDGNILSELGLEEDFLKLSLFEHIYENSGSSNKGRLVDQFRMPENIGNMISHLFYNNDLKNGTFDGKIKKVNESFIFDKEIQWIDVKGEQDIEGTSSFNLKEVDIIVEQIEQIDQISMKKNRLVNIAVITPYSAQKRKIKSKVDTLFESNKIKFLNKDNIKIDTIDSFQGSEAEIVIYSTVKVKGNKNFLLDRKRLNVAISRTKENLIFIGNKNFMKENNKKKSNSTNNENYFSYIISKIEELNS